MPRAICKGYLKIDEVTCPVALYAAASTAERITFHTLNRKTGNRVRREFVDGETGKPVEKEDQVKGYELAPDDYMILDPEEIAATVPESDKTLTVQCFVDCTRWTQSISTALTSSALSSGQPRREGQIAQEL